MFTTINRNQLDYLQRLRPYLTRSLILFSLGILAGLIAVYQFPTITQSVEDSLQSFVKHFRGLPNAKLAAAIFLNNSVKTLAMLLLGTFFGLVPTLFLIVNGAALAVVISLSTQSRGIGLSLLAIIPHGILELPAVFLGSAIGLMLGSTLSRKLAGHADAKLTGELSHALKFFVIVIVPLLLLAAVVETYVTAALMSWE